MSDPQFRYERFFELSPDLLCIAGYDGYFKKINAAVAKTLEYSMEELYARPIDDFVYKDDKEITTNSRKQVIQGRPLFNFENRYRTKSGEIVWLSWTSLPVDADQLIFAIAKNVTYKKKIEAERNFLMANLEQVNKDLRQLTYTTSHDLRAPVNNLLSAFTLLDPSRINDQETIDFLQILELAGENLRQTLNTYVDLLNEKQSALAKKEDVYFQESLDAVLQTISSSVETSKATIHHDFSEAEKVRFNKVYMKSVFLNLVTNAIKYARPDLSAVINIYTRRADDAVKLIIADNGLGFDMEKVKDNIFGLHQTFHKHTDSKGIGLYLVYSHVTSLGGTINVESKINEGTKFTISFPS